MDCEQCIARVAACPDIHSARCADSDALEIQNAPNRATCALDQRAAIEPRPRTQSRARETTAPAPRDYRQDARLSLSKSYTPNQESMSYFTGICTI